MHSQTSALLLFIIANKSNATQRSISLVVWRTGLFNNPPFNHLLSTAGDSSKYYLLLAFKTLRYPPIQTDKNLVLSFCGWMPARLMSPAIFSQHSVWARLVTSPREWPTSESIDFHAGLTGLCCYGDKRFDQGAQQQKTCKVWKHPYKKKKNRKAMHGIYEYIYHAITPRLI